MESSLAYYLPVFHAEVVHLKWMMFVVSTFLDGTVENTAFKYMYYQVGMAQVFANEICRDEGKTCSYLFIMEICVKY